MLKVGVSSCELTVKKVSGALAGTLGCDNLGPWDRVIVYLSLCAVSNHIRRFKRKAWIAHRDFAPIEPLSDDCLSVLAAATALPG